MKTMKNEIGLRLIGSLLSDWCKQRAEKDESFIYRSGFDSTHRVIRFYNAGAAIVVRSPGKPEGALDERIRRHV